jgi:hypothetical protein
MQTIETSVRQAADLASHASRTFLVTADAILRGPDRRGSSTEKESVIMLIDDKTAALLLQFEGSMKGLAAKDAKELFADCAAE